MLGKLSIRNAKRQAKDYIIYFITIAIAIAFMFSFNAIAFSKDIQDLSDAMANFKSIIIGVSIIIIMVIAWLINYTMKFMLEKRSKEFGTYEILGIEKRNISNMFVLENLMIGLFAFIVGIGIGTVLYQILTSIIMNVFNQPYEISMDFNIKAVGLTMLYFFIIFLLALFNSRRKIKKTKVYDLLYAEKKNENSKIKKTRGNVILFLVSIALFAIALFLLNNNFTKAEMSEGSEIIIAIIMIIVGLYLFYISLASFLVKRYVMHKKRKYQKNNLFLYRNLTSKMNTMSITMGTLAMLFTFIIVGGNVALLMNGMLNNEIVMGYPFEIMMQSVDGDFSRYKEYMEKNIEIVDMYEYKTHRIQPTKIRNGLKENIARSVEYYDYDTVIKLSDYNQLRQMLGYEKIELEKEEVMIQSMITVKEQIEKQMKEDNKISILDKEFTVKSVQAEHMAQMHFNGFIYMVVVTDETMQKIEKEEKEIDSMEFFYKLVVKTKGETSPQVYDELSELVPIETVKQQANEQGETQEYEIQIRKEIVQTKAERLSNGKSFYTIISFLAFYIALIFVMASATLLAIQQLSDSEKYKYRYALLKKLGMHEKEVNKLIFKQLLLYFVLPLLIPIIISIPIVLFISNIFTIAITIPEIIGYIASILGLLFFVYGIYFIATFVQFERNINGK